MSTSTFGRSLTDKKNVTSFVTGILYNYYVRESTRPYTETNQYLKKKFTSQNLILL